MACNARIALVNVPESVMISALDQTHPYVKAVAMNFAPTRKIVVIVGGMVGSGKTTLVNKLKDAVSRDSSCATHMAAFPNVSYIFFRILATLLYNCRIVSLYEKAGIHPSTLVFKRIKKPGSTISLLISIIEMISIHVWLLLMDIKCRKASLIIIDEGFINAIANYLEVLKEHSSLLLYYTATLLLMLKRKYLLYLFFLSTSIDALLERWSRRRRPVISKFIGLDHHIRYLKLMQTSLELLRKMGFTIVEINTSYKSPSEVKKELLRALP